MTIYIPLFEIGVFILGYMAFGIALAPHLMLWQNRFLSGNHKGFRDIRPVRAVLVCLLAWPIILGYNIKTEIEYRRKGYL